MDLETEALLFSKPKSLKRRDFQATLFWEKSIRQCRDIQIYGLIAHKIWLELESSPEVIDYNELPLPIAIPIDSDVHKHQFRFAVRRTNGTVKTIDVISDSVDVGKTNVNGSIKDQKVLASITRWCCDHEIEYQTVGSDYFKGKEIRQANIRLMLKFMESAELKLPL